MRVDLGVVEVVSGRGWGSKMRVGRWQSGLGAGEGGGEGGGGAGVGRGGRGGGE